MQIKIKERDNEFRVSIFKGGKEYKSGEVFTNKQDAMNFAMQFKNTING